MAGGPVVPYLKWRVLDPVSGAVLIDPLPHPHQSRFEVWGMQQGMPGATAIGSFSVPLFAPNTKEYAWAKVDYDKLKYGARVEAYLTATPNDPAGVFGDPKFTGVITKMPRDLDHYSIEGSDSLWLAQMARTGRTDLYSNTTDQLLQYGFKAYAKKFGDGDPNTWTLANYTNNGTWTTTTDGGFKTVLSGAGGDGLLYTNTSFTNADYADMYVEASYHLHCDVAATALAEAGVIANVTAANSYVLGRAVMAQLTSTSYRVTAEIYTNGTTQRAYAQQTVVGVTDLRLQVRLVGLQLSSTQYQWRVIVNGVDIAPIWIQTVTPGNPTGAIGLRSFKGGSAAASSAYAAQLVMMSKKNIFQPGSITVGSTTVTDVLTSTPLIDIMNRAATTENFVWRKNPKAGLNNDTIDLGSSPGTDLSNSVFFREGENVQRVTVEPNAEPFASAVTLAGGPGMDGSGHFTWYNLAGIDTYGYLQEVVAAPNLADQVSIRNHAQRIANLRASPGASVTMDVLRDADTADRWRELDTVTVNCPKHYMLNQASKVLGYTLQEGNPVQQVTLVQYPQSRMAGLYRLKSSMDFLLNGGWDIRRVPS